MNPGLLEVRSGAPDAPVMTFGEDARPAPKAPPEHPLDKPESLRLLSALEGWWIEARDAHAENRYQQAIDYDYVDHEQWSLEDAAVLRARGQAPLVYNKLSMAIAWVVGTERRTRIDWKVNPRTKDDTEAAEAKTHLLKYLSDTNRFGWERSLAFKDCAVVGVGWTEESVRGDKNDEPVQGTHVSWRDIWWDPYSRKYDLDDCRYIHRVKWLDLDYACALFPDRAEKLKAAAVDHLFSDLESPDEDTDLPQLFLHLDRTGRPTMRRLSRGSLGGKGTGRKRVKVYETWYRKPVAHKRVWGGDYDGELYDEGNEDMAAGVAENILSLTDAVHVEMRCAMWIEGCLLQDKLSPYRHQQFPFTPYWCYRRNRDGMPYGLVRGARDPQDDYNKRMSKALFLLSTKQAMVEDNAVSEDDEDEFREELAKPNGFMRVRDGALSGKKIEIRDNTDLAVGQMNLLEVDAAQIHDVVGVNRENMGRDTNATSGRAIIAKQQEGAVTTAELFDNYRLGVQISGDKQLSLTEQFMPQPKQFQIAGEAGREAKWIEVNQPVWDESLGDYVFFNDITAQHSRFVVDQIDFRETVRMAMAEQLLEMLAKMPAEIGIQMLDLVIELTDVPNRDEMVARIRKINGHGDPDSDQDGVDEAKAQAEAAEQELTLRERLARTSKDEAQANEIMERANKLRLENKGKALDVAQLLEALLPLAPAADRLMEPTPPPAPLPAQVAPQQGVLQ